MREPQSGCPMGPQSNPSPRYSQLPLPAAPMMPTLAGARKQQGKDRRGTFLLDGGRQDPRFTCSVSLLLMLHSFSPFPFAFQRHPPAK